MWSRGKPARSTVLVVPENDPETRCPRIHGLRPHTRPTARFERHGEGNVIRINNPAVNGISRQTLIGLTEAGVLSEDLRSLQVLLLHCDGKAFVAGDDINSPDDADFADFADCDLVIEAAVRCSWPTSSASLTASNL